MRFLRQATTVLLILVALAVAATTILYVSKDWLVGLGVRWGIAEYNARVNSTLIIQDVTLDLLTLTATARGISVTERGQTPLDASVYVTQASAKLRLWPLLRRQVVLDEVAVSGVNVRLALDRQDHVNLEELFRLVKGHPNKPSPWNVFIHRFAVDQAMVTLAFDGLPVSATLNQMAFRGSFMLQPLHVHAEMLTGQGDVTYVLRQDRLLYHLSQTAATVDVFKQRLVIDHVRVDGKEFTVTGHGGIENAQVSGQFDSDLDLATVASFMPATPPPVGAITVRGAIDGPLSRPRIQLTADGERVGLGPYRASNLSAHLSLIGKRLTLEQLAFRLAGGTVQGTGALDLAPEHIDVQVDVADLAFADLQPLVGPTASVVAGRVAGRVRLVGPSFTLERLRVEGSLALSPPESPPRTVQARQLFPLPLVVRTKFLFEHRTLSLDQTAWDMDGAHGKLAGTLSLDGAVHLTGDVAAHLAAPTFAQLGHPFARGEARLAFSARGNLPEPHVKADFQLLQGSYQGIPIESLRLEIEAERSTVKIVSLAGAQWGGHYQVAGAIDLAAPYSRLHLDSTAFPIRAIAGLRVHVERVNLAPLAPLLPTSMPLAGELTLQAKGSGPWTNLRGEGQIDVRGLMVQKESLGDVSLTLEGSPTQVTLKRLLATVGGGQIEANGRVMLPGRLVDVAMSWQGIRLEHLNTLQDIHLALSGGLKGTVRAHGRWPDLQVGVTVQGPQLTVAGLEVADLQLQATASPQEVILERLTTRLAGAPLSASGRAAYRGPIDIRLMSENIPLRGFALWPKGPPLRGRAQVELLGAGTFEHPQFHGQIQLTNVRAGEMNIGSGRVTLALDDRQMTFSTAGLHAFSLDGAVLLHDTLPARLRLGLRSLDLGFASAQFSGASKGTLEGDVSGTVEVSGQLRVPPSLTGHITLDRLRVRSNEVELQNISPLRWQLAGGVLQFEAVRLQAQGAQLDVRGNINLGRELLDIVVSGTSPLAMVGTRIPGIRFQQGMVNTQVNIRGGLRHPVFEGQALVQDGALYIAALNEHLSQLRGEVQFAEQTIAIQELTGRFAGGKTAVSGELRLQGFQLHDMSLTAEVTDARLRYPTGFFAGLDAEVVVTGNGARQQVTGEINLRQAHYRQEIDLASLIRQYRQRALEPPPMAEERLQFDIRVHTTDPLRVDNRLAKLQLATDLNVRGSPNRPVVLGRVDIEKGTADVAGSRFTSVSGSIDFLNPNRTEPFFDISADTQKKGYQIHVIATGTPQQINLNLTSDPALAEPDILSLLTAGATGTAITTGMGTILPQRVSAFLTGQIAEEISQGVGGIVGIDRLDIEPVVGGAQRVGGPKVTVGKDVSKNLSVTYSTVVGSTLEDLVTVEYRLTDNISVLGVRDERGDVGVDVKFSLRFE